MENNVAKKLDALTHLQDIDSKLDSIIKVRGALPDEVRDLEDEIAGYETRLEKINQEIKERETDISDKKLAIKECQKLIKKYQDQQMNVRNNREYDAITKEMELQELEIQISEKRIKEAHAKIEAKNVDIAEVTEIMNERNKDLKSKKNELSSLTSESEEEEKKLLKEKEKAEKSVEERLLLSYKKIVANARNGLGVVSVKRGACGGCFNVVPPQRQADIKERKKIIVCEHCGRILADVEGIAGEDEKKPVRRRN
jgi:hypothetical protein